MHLSLRQWEQHSSLDPVLKDPQGPRAHTASQRRLPGLLRQHRCAGYSDIAFPGHVHCFEHSAGKLSALANRAPHELNKPLGGKLCRLKDGWQCGLVTPLTSDHGPSLQQPILELLCAVALSAGRWSPTEQSQLALSSLQKCMLWTCGGPAIH